MNMGVQKIAYENRIFMQGQYVNKIPGAWIIHHPPFNPGHFGQTVFNHTGNSGIHTWEHEYIIQQQSISATSGTLESFPRFAYAQRKGAGVAATASRGGMGRAMWIWPGICIPRQWLFPTHDHIRAKAAGGARGEEASAPLGNEPGDSCPCDPGGEEQEESQGAGYSLILNYALKNSL